MLGAMDATRLLQLKSAESVGALEAGGTRQAEAGIELRHGHTDLGVDGNDILLGLGDVRPAPQELGW